MKKAGIALVSVLLAGTMFTFAGCDDGNDPDDNNNNNDQVRSLGAIEGNFEQVDATKAAEVLGAFDFEHAFDQFATDISLKQASEFDIGFNVQVPTELIADYLPSTAAASSAISSFITLEGTVGVSSTAHATIDATGETAKAKEEVDVTFGEYEAGLTLYTDGVSVYLSEDGITGEDFKIKVSLEDIIGHLQGLGGVGGVMAADVVESPGQSMDIASVVTSVYMLGGVVSLDQTDGLKVRVSLGNSFFGMMRNMASVSGGMDTAAATVLNAVTFSDTSLIEIAVAFDEDGQFVEYGVAMDLSVSLDGTKLGGIGGTITVSGKEKTEITTETVTLPENLATDYEEVTVDEILEFIGSMTGGSGAPQPDQPVIKDKEIA